MLRRAVLAWWLTWSWSMGSVVDPGGIAGPFASERDCNEVAESYRALVNEVITLTPSTPGAIHIRFIHRCKKDGAPR